MLTLLLSAFLVTSVMSAVITQQIPQIGILKSLGASLALPSLPSLMAGAVGGNSAVQAARRKDMGVFIISPNDKGGKLYDPPPRLVKLCAPLSPMSRNLVKKAIPTPDNSAIRNSNCPVPAGIGKSRAWTAPRTERGARCRRGGTPSSRPRR